MSRARPGGRGGRPPRPGAAPAAEPDLAELLKRDPKRMRVLQRWGVHVCAGCVLTLTSPAAKAAAYHGVPDVPAFLAALGLSPARKHGGLARVRRRRA